MKIALRLLSGATIVGLLASPATAEEFNNIDRLSQSQFRLLAEDLGAAFSIKGLTAGGSFGLPGVDIGISLGASNINNRSVWRLASSDGSAPDYLPVSSWRATVGLPFNLDLSGQYMIAHSTALRLLGTELRWRFVQEQLTVPALSLSTSYARLIGSERISLNTVGVNLTASKNFALVSPYAGIGRAWSQVKADSAAGLRPVTVGQNRIFAGVRLNLLFDLALEVDRTGETTNFGVKYGLHF